MGELEVFSPMIADSKYECVNGYIREVVGDVSVRVEEAMEPDVSNGLVFGVKENVRGEEVVVIEIAR